MTDVHSTRVSEDPDEALMTAIKAYQHVRPQMIRDRDRHLFMLSKWDIEVNGDKDRLAFPDRGHVEAVLNDRYQSSWAAFESMRASARAKWFVQHSAGLISGRKVIKQDGPTLDRYAQVLWNWLYRSATRSPDQREGRVLFPDAEPVKRKQLPRWLTMRSGS